MNQDISATLLPASRVDFFALDAETVSTARKLPDDWRFARVNVQVTEGGIEGAIETYTQYASPEIVVIETDDISEAFIARLEQLAGVCAEGTDAVIVGPMNDVHLYRSLVGMGVRDYLVRPVGEEDIVNVLAKALVEKKGLSGSRLIAVMGSKGGVGTTAVAQLMAGTIAQDFKQKTLLMDAAGSAGSLGIAFGLEPPTNLADAVRLGAEGSEDDMKRIIQSVNEHLSLLVCGGEPMLADKPDPDSFEALLSRVMKKYPVVVLDLSGASIAVQKRALSLAAHVVMVTTPLLPALRNCRTLMNEIRHIRGGMDTIDLVLNMTGRAGSEEVPEKDIKAALDKEPAAAISHAPKVFVGSEAAGKPAERMRVAHEAVMALRAIAARASAAEVEGVEATGEKEGPFSFLKKIGKAKGKA